MQYVSGQKELVKQLNQLEKKIRTKSLNKAMSKAVRPVVQSAKANVRPVSVTVAKAVGIKRKRYQRGAVQVGVVGVRVADNLISKKYSVNPLTKKKRARDHWPWNTAHLIEFGTAPHEIHLPSMNLTIQHPGTSPKPWLAPALKRNEGRVVKTHATVLRAEVEKYGRA